MGTEKPRIIVNDGYFRGISYLELYSDGYFLYRSDGKRNPNFRYFFYRDSSSVYHWSLQDIESMIKKKKVKELFGEEAVAFLAEQVLKR